MKNPFRAKGRKDLLPASQASCYIARRVASPGGRGNALRCAGAGVLFVERFVKKLEELRQWCYGGGGGGQLRLVLGLGR